MKRIAVIGSGVSGLTAAHFLQKKYDVKIFEKDSQPGGLIKCRRVKGNLFHTCGGHVFNSKRQDVLNWFWSNFTKEFEFTKTERNSVVFMEDNQIIPYPIENHMYLFNADIQRSFIEELLTIEKNEKSDSKNFEEFLKDRFGSTLYNIYFQPYNEKVWRRDLKQVPLSWLEGKLPMPTVAEIIYNNINHVKEKQFVHSTFWYEKNNGSQFIADRLAEGLSIQYNVEIQKLSFRDKQWQVNGEYFDKIVFCGNIKDMIKIIGGVAVDKYVADIDRLEYHGTTSVFCEIDKNPYSWIYQPSRCHESHRIICTGNFAESNNYNLADNRITATIEFTDFIDKNEICDNLKRIPLNPVYLDHQYNKYTYPIQDVNTRSMIKGLKEYLSQFDFYFTGRFADWEYYNMDIAMGASMDLCKSIEKKDFLM